MDYETRPTSRAQVRLYAKLFRMIFNLSLSEPVNPIMLLDRINEVFRDVNYEIIEESSLPKKVPAQCIMTEDGGFLIQIADYVFEGAYERNTGGWFCPKSSK